MSADVIHDYIYQNDYRGRLAIEVMVQHGHDLEKDKIYLVTRASPGHLKHVAHMETAWSHL